MVSSANAKNLEEPAKCGNAPEIQKNKDILHNDVAKATNVSLSIYNNVSPLMILLQK